MVLLVSSLAVKVFAKIPSMTKEQRTDRELTSKEPMGCKQLAICVGVNTVGMSVDAI